MQLTPEKSKQTQHTSSCNCPPRFRASSGCGPWWTLWDTIRTSPSTMKPPPPPWKLSVLRTFEGRLQASLSICQLWTLIITSPPDVPLNACFEDVQRLKSLITLIFEKTLSGLKPLKVLKQVTVTHKTILDSVFAFCLCTKLNLRLYRAASQKVWVKRLKRFLSKMVKDSLLCLELAIGKRWTLGDRKEMP